jgi:predicted alpha/beta hydrolase
VINTLGLDPAKVNPMGGAIALGHPLGATGAIRAATVVHALRRHKLKYGMVTMCVGMGQGAAGNNAPRLKRMVPYFWWVLVPLATRLCGYFPGRKLRKVGDLPAGVILQWRRWCLNPTYSVGAEGPEVAQRYGAVRFPVLALSMSDDELMTLRGTQALVNLYSNAPTRVERIAPQDVKALRIGHFGFFREQFRQSLWPRAVADLAALARPAAQSPA